MTDSAAQNVYTMYLTHRLLVAGFLFWRFAYLIGRVIVQSILPVLDLSLQYPPLY